MYSLGEGGRLTHSRGAKVEKTDFWTSRRAAQGCVGEGRSPGKQTKGFFSIEHSLVWRQTSEDFAYVHSYFI